jgi:hypothetical protein
VFYRVSTIRPRDVDDEVYPVEPKQNPPEVETGGFSFQKIAILDTDSRSQKSTETKLMLVTASA